MSEWYESGTEEIDIDEKEQTLDIYVKTNDFGRVYTQIKIVDMIKVLKDAGKI